MELSPKIVDCVQSLSIFAKHFILGVSQGYEYASNETKQNPCALSLKFHIKLALQYLQISSTFKFNFIFTLTCGETLLITNSIHTFFLFQIGSPMHLNTYDIN